MPPTSEPESTPEPEKTPFPRPEGEPKGEPLPEWTVAMKTWGAGWPCHWIGYAVLFALLTITALVLLRKLLRNRRQRKTMTKFSLTVTTIVTLFFISRFLYLIINPYESPHQCLFGYGKCPLFISRFLFSLGIPSLVSAFLLVHLALLDVMKLRKLSNFTRLQKWPFLVGLVSVNYVLSCTIDLVVSYKAASNVFLVLCQAYFIIFSAGLVFGFSYTGLSLYIQNKKTTSEVYKLASGSGKNVGEDQKKKKSIRKVLKLTVLTVILGLAFLVSQLYTLVTIYKMSSDVSQTPTPWPWLICQYVYRFVELSMAACLLYNISYMPKQKVQQEASKDPKWQSLSASKHGRANNASIKDGGSHTREAPHGGESPLPLTQL